MRRDPSVRAKASPPGLGGEAAALVANQNANLWVARSDLGHSL
jgi:hypothetical protein